MRRLKIVIALHQLPLPFGGAAARWYYVLLKGLAERGHEVIALAPFSDLQQADEARKLFSDDQLTLHCHRIENISGWRGKFAALRRPFASMYSEAYQADLQSLMAAAVDVLHIEQLWGGWLGFPFADRCVVNVHYLFSIDWAEETGGTARDRLIRWNARRAERSLLKALPRFFTLTDRLTRKVKSINPSAQVTTVPMAIDLSLYPFNSAAANRPENHSPTLGLIGSFDWTPSLAAGNRLLTRIWPKVLQRVPEANLRIVGRRARDAFAHLPPSPRTEFFQDVPDTLPFFTSLDVLLYAPDIGSGMKVKIMEAFALGTPVVTNIDGIEGLPAVDGVHVAIAQDDAGLIERAVQLLTRPQERQSQRLQARRLIEDRCAPDQILSRLEAFYMDMRKVSESR